MLLVVPGRAVRPRCPVWFERRETEVGVEVVVPFGAVVELGCG
ncbi:hypothetical protein [Umezawaea sp.]